jgi:hypothetical protein
VRGSTLQLQRHGTCIQHQCCVVGCVGGLGWPHWGLCVDKRHTTQPLRAGRCRREKAQSVLCTCCRRDQGAGPQMR